MVLVNGEDDNIWLAYVSSANSTDKTCKVFFYIPSTHAHGIRNSGSGQVYVKERHRLETVHWQSIIEIQLGTWLPNNTFRIAQ